MSLQFQYVLPLIVTIVAVLCLGAFVFFKNPKARAHQLWLVFNISIAAWAIPQCLYITANDLSKAYLLVRLSYIFGVLWIPTLYLNFIFILLNQQKRWPLYLAYGFSLVYLSQVLNPQFLPPPRQKFSLNFYPEAGPLYYPFFVLWSAVVIYAIRELYINLRKAGGAWRNQLRYLFYSSCIGYVGGFSNFLPVFNIELQPYNPYGNYGIPIYTAIFAYAIVRHHLLDINVVMRKGLIYSLLIGVITAVYIAIVLFVGRSVQDLIGWQTFGTTLLALTAIALLFKPLEHRIQQLVDRYFFKETQGAILRENERLRQEVLRSEKLKALSTLAAGMAHEIKNPLTSIKTFAAYLPKKANDPIFQQKFQRIVTQEVDKIDQIVRQLLDFAKPAPPQLQPIQLSRLLDETLDFLSNDCLSRRIHIERSYALDDTIQADPQQLRQVFLNLFLNSLEAMDGTGGTLSVATTTHDARLLVAIQDTGQGIPKEHLNRIFDPFFTTKSNGTGLGLSIVHRILTEHGGTIHIGSQRGQGTTVRLAFPLSAVTDVELDRVTELTRVS